ncbi:phage holin family protein [Rahnella inusitata]|uniref:phage holin family protein n=1 Tax=Rahnella inusitata TaxID=58169 RepID=UPI001BC83831|nr:phage holin family protein [Rahnella inusitata]QUT14182.1 phage holin family protein [Rahnella inusitata]
MIGATHARDIVLMDRDIVMAIIGMSAWGGIVRYIMLRQKKPIMEEIRACVLQVIVSCFSGMLLSIFVLAHDANDDRLLVIAGLGGVFAGPIITLLGRKFAAIIENFSPGGKEAETAQTLKTSE